MSGRTRPYPYQVRGAKRIQRFGGRCLLADEQGLGKSLESLWWADHYLGADAPLLIVCPAALKYVWEHECRTHLGVRAQVLASTTPPRRLPPGGRIHIINYDVLGPWLHLLTALRPQLIILDESHYLGSPHSQRTRLTRILCKGAPHVLALSGTPLVNRPPELFPVLNILRPDLFPAFHPFVWEYTKPRKTFWGWEYKEPRNLGKLHHLLKNTCMVRRLKSEVLKELPAQTRAVVPLDVSDRGEYQKAVADFLGWLRERRPERVRRAARAEAVTRAGYLLRLVGELKVAAVAAWVENFLLGGNKLLLFAVHKKVISTLRARFKGLCVVVDGSVTGKGRQGAFDAFNHNPRVRLFIGNLKAAGVGWSCKSAADVAFGELGWTPGDLAQAMARVHGVRRGLEGRKSLVHFLLARNTVEEKLCKLLEFKQQTAAAVLDGGRPGTGGDLLDRLCEILRKEGLHAH